MIFDIVSPCHLNSYSYSFEESPNSGVLKFYNMLDATQRPLWLGCTVHTKLSIALKMLNIKFGNNIPHGCFDEIIMLLKEANPKRNLIPPNFYEITKLVSKLSLGQKKRYCCINGYTLFYKGDEMREVVNFVMHIDTRALKGKRKI